MSIVNIGVGALSTYMVFDGKYYKWNNVWHQTKTKGIAWRWQKRWNKYISIVNRKRQIQTVAKARNLSNNLIKAGGSLILADIFLSGEIKPSHAVNGVMLGISTTGIGTMVAGAWFLADYGTMGINYVFTGEPKSISDMIDESIGTYEFYEGFY